MNIRDKHIMLVELVNNSKSRYEHDLNLNYLRGWRTGVYDTGYRISLIECDLHYINNGIDVPMCGGVFLDWEPTE